MALRVCLTPAEGVYTEVQLVAGALAFHIGFQSLSGGASNHPSALAAMTMTEGIQQYAMQALRATAAFGSFVPLPAQHRSSATYPLPCAIQSFTSFFVSVVEAGKMRDLRLSALLTDVDGGILITLRAALSGFAGFESAQLSSRVLHLGWSHFAKLNRSPEGSPEVHRSAQYTVLEALRQSASLLQLAALAPAQRQLALNQAWVGGFLQVCPFVTCLNDATPIHHYGVHI